MGTFTGGGVAQKVEEYKQCAAYKGAFGKQAAVSVRTVALLPLLEWALAEALAEAEAEEALSLLLGLVVVAVAAAGSCSASCTVWPMDATRSRSRYSREAPRELRMASRSTWWGCVGRGRGAGEEEPVRAG